ncbi:hypothetical protein [Paludisphaera sp.]|uniref:hypothetical protein n=1 Tax=Paludisphaera sp. TaxID=2017432 RepID=UPI00301E5A26
MIHRRKLPAAALLLACSLPLVAGCGESGGVSAVPVKGEASAGGSSTQPKMLPSASGESAAPAAAAKAGGKQLAPLETVE